MSDIFHEYMSKRLGQVDIDAFKTIPGPVVTLSRAAGCSSQQIARELALRLNHNSNSNEWEVVSKEVLHESAEKLKLDPKQIKSIFKTKNHNFLEEIVQTFLSSDYHLEKKMRNTVIKVIHKFAVEGHKIILGRGGNIICNDIEHALHIRIDAPLEWRIEKIMNSRGISKDEAAHFIVNTEKERSNFRKTIKGKKFEPEYFDITFNQSKFSNSEIIDFIINALEFKKII